MYFFLPKILRFQINKDSRERESTSSGRAQHRVQFWGEDRGRKSQLCHRGDYCPVRIPHAFTCRPFLRTRMSPSIMKDRRTMKTQPLIQEVISRLYQQSIPRIPDIKKVCHPTFAAEGIEFLTSCWIQAIDTLLEKEYLERVDGTRDMLNYIP
jgi:hypothetical protein